MSHPTAMSLQVAGISSQPQLQEYLEGLGTADPAKLELIQANPQAFAALLNASQAAGGAPPAPPAAPAGGALPFGAAAPGGEVGGMGLPAGLQAMLAQRPEMLEQVMQNPDALRQLLQSPEVGHLPTFLSPRYPTMLATTPTQNHLLTQSSPQPTHTPLTRPSLPRHTLTSHVATAAPGTLKYTREMLVGEGATRASDTKCHARVGRAPSRLLVVRVWHRCSRCFRRPRFRSSSGSIPR